MPKCGTKMLAALACAAMLSGCASGPSHIQLLAAMVNPLDVVAIAAGGYVVWRLSEMPAWEVKLRPESRPQGRIEAELEKSMGSLGGDGSASHVFSVASRKWCEQKGLGPARVVSFVEFYEPHMLGAKRKARGEFECEE